MAENASSPAWHALTPEQVAAEWKVDLTQGLSPEEAARRLAEYGRNEITRQSRHGLLVTFLLQFHQPLIYILLAATVVTLFMKEYIDAAVIFGVVLVNAIVGMLQEHRAAKAIDALAKAMIATATVRRGGQIVRLPSPELVPGDVVLLQSGDQVPADVRLVRVKDLRVSEAALTGESVPIEKAVEELPTETPLADRKNLAFATALVTYGQATGIVVATGDRTEVGKIQRLISTADELATPLTREISRFSKWLMYVILGIAAFTFVVGLLHQIDVILLFHSAVALAVAMIPEGLPAAVTVVLAMGVRRMAARHAIIRKLPAVEALGSTSIICSDKTGTLTENQMTVQKIWAGGRLFSVTGTGYAPEGTLHPDDAQTDDITPALECLRCGVLCNDSRLVQKNGRWEIDGDPTEGALIVAARKAGLDEAKLAAELPRIDAVPFESEHQYMATLHDAGEEWPRIVYLKGSVEKTLERCTGIHPEEVHTVAEEMGALGLRVLAFAQKELPPTQSTLSHADVQTGLTFLGLQGMIDPPRTEAIHAIRECHRAGIRVKMITGDHATTAAAIAAQLGLGHPDGIDGHPPVITGKQLDAIPDEKLPAAATAASVFARVTPEQKLRLVKALQADGSVVAMTGDGVNDAPALKQADIGVAMGITGTEVAKDAADMVLTDDNFASIVAAVEEGRGVFDNLTKFIVWTLPTNLGQGLVILVAVMLGVTLPMLPVQVLWVNMATAIFLGMTLTFEPKEPGLMDRPPRDPKQSFITPELLRRMVLVGLAMLGGAFGLFTYETEYGAWAGTDHGLTVGRTVAVSVFIMVQSAYLLNCRRLQQSVFGEGFWNNPWVFAGIATMVLTQLLIVYTPVLNIAFHTAPMPLEAWLRVLGVAAGVFILVEIETWLVNRYQL
jgi:Ca2+-transporting ATPase